jgi:hypothetical protein
MGLGLVLVGCDTYQGGSGAYYGGPMYSRGFYTAPGYPVPYGYQPGWRGGEAPRGQNWRERQWRSNQPEVQRPAPAPAAPSARAPAPPSATNSQASENRRLLDQLGFQPSR